MALTSTKLRDLAESCLNEMSGYSRQLGIIMKPMFYHEDKVTPIRLKIQRLQASFQAEVLEILRNDEVDSRHSDQFQRAAQSANFDTLFAEVWRIAEALERPVEEDRRECLVTLEQAAGIAQMHKRTLEGYLADGQLPAADYPGGGGRAARWVWRKLRLALQKASNRADLPEQFPADRLQT